VKTTEDESRKFWEEKEREKGGKVTFFTFATFWGISSEKQVNTGGLLYTIDGTIYFEDFERENWFSKILGKRQKWEKTEFAVKKKDIVEFKKVSKNSALNCITGLVPDTETKTVSQVFQFLAQSVLQIRLRRGFSLFLDVMREKDFLSAVKEMRESDQEGVTRPRGTRSGSSPGKGPKAPRSGSGGSSRSRTRRPPSRRRPASR
jgi:hypothetical protein